MSHGPAVIHTVSVHPSQDVYAGLDTEWWGTRVVISVGRPTAALVLYLTPDQAEALEADLHHALAMVLGADPVNP